jgi:hypothetical protein
MSVTAQLRTHKLNSPLDTFLSRFALAIFTFPSLTIWEREISGQKALSLSLLFHLLQLLRQTQSLTEVSGAAQ